MDYVCTLTIYDETNIIYSLLKKNEDVTLICFRPIMVIDVYVRVILDYMNIIVN